MLRAAVLLLLVGCGKVASTVDAGPGQDAAADASPDGLMVDGLVAWYRMDAATTGVVDDATGRHNGTCEAGRCPAFTPTGVVGGAFVFDGADDLFHVTSAAELEGTQGFTVTAWINRSDGSAACVVNKSYEEFGANSWQACLTETNVLAFYSTSAGADTGEDALISDTVFDSSRWYHIALSWSAGTKAIYIDGRRDVDKDNISILFDDADINIGSDIDGTDLVAPFRGQIDDVRIYNRGLSQAEIMALASR